MTHPNPSREEQFEDSLKKMNQEKASLCKTGSGEDWAIEDMANYLLAKSRRGVTKHSEMRDWLSLPQLELRKSREVSPTQGYPEKYLFNGLYKRVYNPKSRGPHTSNATPNLEIDTETYYGGE